MKKAVIYARFSSHSQTEQSIEGQLRVCEEFAKRNDILILDTYIDRKKTGQNDIRPNFQKMLRDSSSRQWDYVIIYAIDRFARDDGDYGADKKLLRQNGVKILSATEITGTNADGSENLSGILTEGLLVSLAKYYSRELSKKVKRGQFESIQKKLFLGGAVLYGYVVVDKEIKISPPEAQVVREIFDAYANGLTAKNIAFDLKERQITNNKGRYFCVNSIMNMLKNKKYNGVFEYGDYYVEDYYPKIIDDKTFDIVARKIEKNKRSPARMKAYENYRLSGKLYCGHCKSLMTGEAGTSKSGIVHHYYKCFGKKKHNGCKKLSVRKDELESLVASLVLNHILAPDKILDTIENIVISYNEDIKEDCEITILKKELAENNKFINNIITAIKNGIITESTQKELVELEDKKKALNEAIAKKEAEEDFVLTKERVLFYFDEFIKDSLSDEEAKDIIIERLVNKVILYDNKITIVLYNKDDHSFDADIDMVEDLCSDLTQSAPPKSHNPNTIYTKHFIVLDYTFTQWA